MGKSGGMQIRPERAKAFLRIAAGRTAAAPGFGMCAEETGIRKNEGWGKFP